MDLSEERLQYFMSSPLPPPHYPHLARLPRLLPT
ncbi:unnamed protein product [Arabidopsis halleri]